MYTESPYFTLLLFYTVKILHIIVYDYYYYDIIILHC